MYNSTTSTGSAPSAQGAQTFTQSPNSSSVGKGNKHCWDVCQVIEPKNYKQAYAEWIDRAAKYLSSCLKKKDYNVIPEIIPNQYGLRELAHLAAKAHRENVDFLDLVAASKHAT